MVAIVLLVILLSGLLVLFTKRRRLFHAVRDRAFLPGPPGIWDSEWVHIPASAICAEDIAHWPYTPGLLVKWVAFLGTLHWPVGDLDLGLVVFLLWNCSFFMSFGLVRGCLWRRLILVIFDQGGIDIWRSCRFIGALMRSLCLLPGGLGRFLPCSIGANHCRLRHLGWERCGHGLTSRPRESASELFLDELLDSFLVWACITCWHSFP